jgi:hypothetical protein
MPSAGAPGVRAVRSPEFVSRTTPFMPDDADTPLAHPDPRDRPVPARSRPGRWALALVLLLTVTNAGFAVAMALPLFTDPPRAEFSSVGLADVRGRPTAVVTNATSATRRYRLEFSERGRPPIRDHLVVAADATRLVRIPSSRAVAQAPGTTFKGVDLSDGRVYGPFPIDPRPAP